MAMVHNTSSNQEYLDSGKWKCDKSPGGAHHWIIKYDQMTCKYCTQTRQISLSPQFENSN